MSISIFIDCELTFVIITVTVTLKVMKLAHKLIPLKNWEMHLESWE